MRIKQLKGRSRSTAGRITDTREINNVVRPRLKRDVIPQIVAREIFGSLEDPAVVEGVEIFALVPGLLGDDAEELDV